MKISGKRQHGGKELVKGARMAETSGQSEEMRTYMSGVA